MKIIRSGLYARQGHMLMEVDFSQLEVGIAACYHKDPVMLDYLIHKKDLHKDMSMQIFGLKNFDKSNPHHSLLRKAAKNGFVFPQFYGDYYKNNLNTLCEWIKLNPQENRWSRNSGTLVSEGIHISDHFKSIGISGAASFLNHIRDIEYDFWNNRFKVYENWKNRAQKEYLRKGFVESLTGFRFNAPLRKNEIVNYPVQGAAFHCLLWTFIQLDKWLLKNQMDTKILGQIHDAIVLDVHPQELTKVSRKLWKLTTSELAKAWPWIIVPLSVEAELGAVDGSWADLKEFPIHEFC